MTWIYFHQDDTDDEDFNENEDDISDHQSSSEENESSKEGDEKTSHSASDLKSNKVSISDHDTINESRSKSSRKQIKHRSVSGTTISKPIAIINGRRNGTQYNSGVTRTRSTSKSRNRRQGIPQMINRHQDNTQIKNRACGNM